MSEKVDATFHDGFRAGQKVTVGTGTTPYVIAALEDQVDASGAHYRMARLESETGRATDVVETSRLKAVRSK